MSCQRRWLRARVAGCNDTDSGATVVVKCGLSETARSAMRFAAGLVDMLM